MNIRLCINFIIILLLTGCARHPHEALYKAKPASYSYIIGDIKTPRIYKEYAADIYATPASCQKTITALVALKALGADYQYETKLYVSRKHGSIQNLMLSFSGDPTLSSEDLLNLLHPLKDTQVKNKIILDASIFKTPLHSPNIMIGDIGTSYGQPISSINIDKNLITVKITPANIGELGFVTSDNGNQIHSTVITSSDVSSARLSWDGEHIKATGNINLNDTFLELKVSPKEIDSYILGKVSNVLKDLNIKGKIEIIHDKSKLPSNLVLAGSIKSEMLKDTLPPALKASDNLIFDSLYLTILQSESPNDIEDWSEGDKIIKGLIKKYFAIDMDKALFVDGSGLSRYNRIQTRKLLELLRQGFLIPEFVSALPMPGEEKSTLEKRTNLPSSLRAKTGSMAGIRCLCGYSIDLHKPKAFVFMASSFAPPVTELLDVMDKFINAYLGK